MSSTNQVVQTEKVGYIPLDTAIDYFKIPADLLEEDRFKVEETTITFEENEYIDIDKHFVGLDHDKRETVLMNIQVGKGKTTACYNLIEEYANKGYLVLVLSPFIKLVEKDYEALSGLRGIHTFNYNNLRSISSIDDNSFVKHFINCQIQVMTINCFLQNPGEGSQQQVISKTKYLKALFDNCVENGKKVVIFFDEIHESIHNFHFALIPFLLSWEPVVHKCFISSATYIPASIPVIKFIALLTEGNIKIYDAPRHKTSLQAKLHLHFTDEHYSSGMLHSLSHLTHIINGYGSTHRINILTGYKSMTDTLTQGDNRSNIATAVKALNPKILTADTEYIFDPNGNNIGTTFKTGINMLGNDSVLIIILPCVKNKHTSLGVFTDGLPSIIQSLARVREDGNIHVFLYKPAHILDGEILKNHVHDVLIHGAKEADHIIQNKGLETIKDNYENIFAQKEGVLSWINSQQIENNESGYNLGYCYPSYEQHLINDSQTLMVKNYPSFGSDISSYVLWASLNNQFCNATIDEITFTSTLKQNVELTNDNLQSILKTFLGYELIMSCQRHSLKNCFIELISHIKYTYKETVDEDGNRDIKRILNAFTLNRKSILFPNLIRRVIFVKAILNIIIEAWSDNQITSLQGYEYLGICIKNATGLSTVIINHSLSECYKLLNELKWEFLEFVSSNLIAHRHGYDTVHKDLYASLPDNFIQEVVTIAESLKRLDFFIEREAIPFLSDINNKNGDDLKRYIYNQFKKYFTNIGIEPYAHLISISGREEYYRIVDSLEKEINPRMAQFQLLY